MLSANYGIINQFLKGLGLPVFNWFMDTKTAFGTILLIDVWQNVPFVFLLLYASLQSVSENQYEAARIDGARLLPAVLVHHPAQHQGQPGPVRPAADHRHLPPVREGERPHRRWPAGTTTTITQFLYTYGIKSLGTSASAAPAPS